MNYHVLDRRALLRELQTGSFPWQPGDRCFAFCPERGGSPSLASRCGVAKLSLKHTLVLLLASIAVLSSWLHFMSSVFSKAGLAGIFFDIIKAFKRESLCPYMLRIPGCLTRDLLGTRLPLLGPLALCSPEPLWPSPPSFLWLGGPLPSWLSPFTCPPGAAGCHPSSVLLTRSLVETAYPNFPPPPR